MVLLALLLPAISLPAFVHAFTFTINEAPVQCGQLTLNWTGGVAPYEVTLLPLNGINTTTAVWTDSLIDTNITTTSWTYPVKFPAGLNFTLVMSDATGFGTGGTSQIYTVANSSDSSCLPAALHPLQFFFELENNTRIVQCDQINFQISGAVALPVTLRGIVPGGESWQYVTPSFLTSNNWPAGWSEKQMNWTLQLIQGTQVAFMLGDQTGPGSGGTTQLLTVSAGSSDSCLSQGYFSTTPAPAAGAALETAPASSPSATAAGTSSGSTSHTGAIVGGVIGGLAGIVLLIGGIMFLMRRYNKRKRQRRLQSINLQTYTRGHRTRLQDSVDSKSGFIIEE
ncbi:hypothetical protein CALCODRAFT_497455 [Calocera cornea HHB12733]|uniref:Uncharacterized protein n=1 Tax=Calocera cornea HHB12733 TaxID=1353952 RepID=A0A165F959_9BASI|nr:hypothetical protein CALCODRAFT_497455 [Calocera cornea HHB12733]